MVGPDVAIFIDVQVSGERGHEKTQRQAITLKENGGRRNHNYMFV